jgi:branched-subunit amino acid aminotransferase/4-amino-4-deoxychorismate lyase
VLLVQVLVAGEPRPAAHAKHCEWVAARQPLEALRQQAGADEVVLLDSSSGALLEGLVTNVFVLADVAAAAAQLAGGSSSAARATGAGSGPCAGLVLLTTGPQHSALQGVMQQRVVQTCRGLGLPVLLQPARLGQQAAWRGAFLTNWCVEASSRLWG